MKGSKFNDTSWETSHDWYDRIVGTTGHYYHEHVILPGVLKLLGLKPSSHLLDLACGQGILARNIPKETIYTGVDLSASLIKAAKSYDNQKNHEYFVSDVTKPLSVKNEYTHASIILALQNISDPLAVFKNAKKHLKEKGKFIMVLNHPCFRIPRQSSWQVDEAQKIQYRRINRYGSPLKIPIQTHPGKKESENTTSFHFPISDYCRWLKEAGFMIETIEEWYSDKKSTGKAAAMENRSRQEFPLFLTILAHSI